MSRQRIVITGLGGLCALGTNVADIWDAMRSGRSAIGTLSTPLLRDAKTNIGAEIKQLPDWSVDRRKLVAIDRFALLAAMAADEAIRNAAIDVQAMDSGRIGAVVGTGIFGAEAADENYFGLLKEGKSRANVFTVPRIMPSAPAGQVSMIHGLRGPVFGVTSACASSNHAFAAAADQIRLGRADVMLAGGTDAPLVFGVVKGWEALRALARETCRPFSNDRDGLVLGEGSAIAVMESYEHAKARGATILAEFAGAGMSADASDIVSPTVEGPAAAMRACLADADLDTGDVNYINAHGTGTKANDQIETAAIRAVFGPDGDKVSVSSTKSMHAHCMGASGALEVIACVMAIREGIVPPTANYREKDPDCDLDVTPNVAKQRPVRAAISNAFAFGGTNAVVAFKSA
ncbi:MAG: beta-ketoacyl-[acyl-carrier-protein] synthase family protein [Mesorhizobium sp.]